MIFREQRTILPKLSPSSSQLTVWLGIYNATQYIESLANQISNQKFDDYHLLVVDNASTDDSWDKLQRWLVEFEGRITLIRNPVNLGLWGSLELNRDYIKSEWFLPIHQDDYYLPNHFVTHFHEIQKSGQDVVAISTDMGSMRNDGKRLMTLPRGSWFPAGNDSPSRFIQNLFSIIVPQPATSFKTKEFFEVLGPWHDWSYTDVEFTLKLIAKGKFVQVKSQTMLYRENPLSASHSISETERKLAAAVGLTRVFASKEFIQIAQEVDAQDRDAFTKAIKQGIELRLGRSELSAFVSLISAESLAYAWSYEVREPNNLVYAEYESINTKNVTQFFDGIMKAYGVNRENTEGEKDSDSNRIDWQELLNIGDGQMEQSGKSFKRNLKIIAYQILFGLIPYRARRFIVEKTLVVAFKLGFKHRWNFNWR